MADIEEPIELWVATDEDGDKVRLDQCEDEETGVYWQLRANTQADETLVFLDDEDLERLYETIGKILKEK